MTIRTKNIERPLWQHLGIFLGIALGCVGTTMVTGSKYPLARNIMGTLMGWGAVTGIGWVLRQAGERKELEDMRVESTGYDSVNGHYFTLHGSTRKYFSSTEVPHPGAIVSLVTIRAHGEEEPYAFFLTAHQKAESHRFGDA